MRWGGKGLGGWGGGQGLFFYFLYWHIASVYVSKPGTVHELWSKPWWNR